MAEIRRFYIKADQISGDKAMITGQDARHARKVLRLGVGDPVILVDNSGYEYSGIIQRIASKDMEVELGERKKGLTESPLKIDLAQAMIKTSKMDKMLKAVTEVGIHGWYPFYAARSVPKAKDPEERQARWVKIAAEAIKQCERVRLPEIAPPGDFAGLLARCADYDLGIVFWEKSRVPFAHIIQSSTNPPPGSVLVVIGPEGGIEDGEMAQLEQAGMIHAGLGPRILRAETAALVACTLVQAVLGDLGGFPVRPADPLWA
ncbi:MAG: 16S rRNA (uracil(1498)-N(3))-methyltransferase [Desulfatibacillum sp.]|nr:16S rRNA (uracil(1498)-N(3))-methyltransferase [Desulfatibacillum sp.]